jgi:hypothetical protein
MHAHVEVVKNLNSVMEKMPHSDSDLNTMSESLRSQVHSEDQILE